MSTKYLQFAKHLKTLVLVVALCGFQPLWRIAAQAQIIPPQKNVEEKSDSDDKDDNGKSEEGEISTVLTPANKNAFFDDKAKYTFEVKNTTSADQTGKVSYTVTTEKGQQLFEDSISVKIGKNSSEKYNFDVPSKGVGFYKVNFMINVTDYDDTTRRVFGIKPEQIVSQHQKPADFEEFWQNTKQELAQVKPKFKVVGIPRLDKDNRHVYLIEMQSLDKMTIRGWMTVPINRNPNKKFAVLLGLPGYQVALNPLTGLDPDLVIITLNVRGQGNSRGPVDTRRDEYIVYHIEDKNKYVMRGAIADCLRCVDFICAQPNLRHDQILVSGGSMGGFLSVATASLDKRVKLCSAQNPILCDIRGMVGSVKWPISTMVQYVGTQPGLSFNTILDNMDYFDVKNFASNLTCPTIMGIGLLDPFAPPDNEYAAYNNIKPAKRIMVFKDLGHEITAAYKNLEGRWMRDAFGLF
jgi:cephalosporin-C deacetylase